MANKPRTEIPEIRTHKAAIALGMTPDGVRRFCKRTGYGRTDDRGRLILTAAEIETIRRARHLVWGRK